MESCLHEKWQRASNDIMNTKLDLSLLIGVHQIFHHRCDVESIIITKYVDDLLLVTRNEEWVDRAIGGIEQSFEI